MFSALLQSIGKIANIPVSIMAYPIYTWIKKYPHTHKCEEKKFFNQIHFDVYVTV